MNRLFQCLKTLVKIRQANKIKIIDDRYLIFEEEQEDKHLVFDMFKRNMINYDVSSEDYLINIFSPFS